MTNTKGLFIVLLSIGTQFICNAQKGIDFTAKDYIKTVQFSGLQQNDGFPIVALGEKFELKFDDLNGDEADYYYRFSFYNHDWSKSTLFKNEFLEGFDNLRIDKYITSFNTLQTYTHFQLELPNNNIQFKVSGNYVLEVYSSDDELVFSRRFCIYDPQASIQAGVFRTQNMDRFSTHQSVHFTIIPNNISFRNPKENINVVLLQNQQWDRMITDLKPQYFNGRAIEYRYGIPSQFEGGNEYFYFDTKDLRITTPNISYINRASLYESYLNIDIPRLYSDYAYAPDINGKYEIRNIMVPGNSDTEADYGYVYFSLASDYNLKEEEIFIYGNFNAYELKDENKMYYNPALEIYEGLLLLKQGFYNYKYIMKSGDQLKKNAISDSHALTENDYQVLVYYRNIGMQYDALIGVGNANSFELQN